MRASSVNPARPQSMAEPTSKRYTMHANESPASIQARVGTGATSSGGPTMRGSMRESSRRREKSPARSVLSFRKGSRSQSVSDKPRRAAVSRFNDSDDEGPSLPRLSGSRRRDSSDEDEPKNFRPVRGIPRRTDEGESSDLDDSDNEPPAAALSKAGPDDETRIQALVEKITREKATTNGNGPVDIASATAAPAALFTNGHSSLVTPFGVTKEQPKRRSIMSVLGRRRTELKIVKSNEESIARRDTPLERTRFERSNTGLSTVAESQTTSTQASPVAPKLQRRSAPEGGGLRLAGIDPNNWPIPESPTQTKMQIPSRPKTSDGNTAPSLMGSTRPGLGRGLSAEGDALGRSGKKKKFPMLRRAFGLHD